MPDNKARNSRGHTPNDPHPIGVSVRLIPKVAEPKPEEILPEFPMREQEYYSNSICQWKYKFLQHLGINASPSFGEKQPYLNAKPPQTCVFNQKNVYWEWRFPMPTVTIDIPEDIADLMVCDNKSDELRRNALLLYSFIKNETISHGRAAEILGISKWELIELYGSEGIPYIDQSWDEAEQDASNIKELLAKR